MVAAALLGAFASPAAAASGKAADAKLDRALQDLVETDGVRPGWA